MKIITAMLQPFMLSKVVSTLEAIDGFPGMTLTEVRGFGRRRSAREEHGMHLDDFHQKSRIEIVAPDDLINFTFVGYAIPSSRTNADDRLSRDPLGRVEGGDRIVEGRDVADVCPQPSVTYAPDDLCQLGTIGFDN